MAESTWPSWPQMPVSCVTSGTCRGENQCGTSRSTEMNVTASPRPTTARAAIASGQRFGEREHQLARRHHGGAGDDQRLRAESVEQQPRGHLRAGIHDDLQDHERRQHDWGWRRSDRRRPDRKRQAWCGRGRRRCRRVVRWPRRSRDAHRTFHSEDSFTSNCCNALRLHHLPSGRADANSETVKSLTRRCLALSVPSWLNLHALVGITQNTTSYSQISAYTSDS